MFEKSTSDPLVSMKAEFDRLRAEGDRLFEAGHDEVQIQKERLAIWGVGAAPGRTARFEAEYDRQTNAARNLEHDALGTPWQPAMPISSSFAGIRIKKAQ